MPSLSADQKRAVMRRFILQAPPGQVHAVLKALRSLMQDDALFMDVAPTLVAEQLAVHHVPVRYANAAATAAGGGGAALPPAFGLTPSTHVANWVGALPAAMRSAVVEAEGLPESFLEFSFTDWNTKQVAVVDPLTAAVVTSSTFADVFRSASDMDAESVPSDLRALAAFAAAGTKPSSGGLGFTPQTLQRAVCLALREAVAVEVEAYVTRRYRANESVATASVAPMLDAFVSVGDGGNDSDAPPRPVLRIDISATRVNDAACWEGRWRSELYIAFDPNSDAGDAALFTLANSGGVASPAGLVVSGSTRTDFTYYEDGNIHMDSRHPVSASVPAPRAWAGASSDAAAALVRDAAQRLVNSSSCTVASDGSSSGAPLPDGITAVARRVVRAIENSEDTLQENITQTSRNAALTDAAMKPLRRKLPVTKQTFDFSARLDVTSTRRAFDEKRKAANAGAGDGERS